MASKTFKIGEACIGGVLTAETTAGAITIKIREWDTSAGYSRGSNQSGAKVINTYTVRIQDRDVYMKLHNFISDNATHYWADQVMEWVESKSKLKKQHFYSY